MFEIEIEIGKGCSKMPIQTRFPLLIIEIEIEKGRSTLTEIEIYIDKFININVMPRPCNTVT
jgi:hypothetical protein